jgi:hypothetical protein
MSVVFPSQCTEEMKSRPPQSPSSSPHQSVRGFRRAQLIWRAHGRGFPRGAARGGRTRASQTGQFPVPGDACGPGRRGRRSLASSWPAQGAGRGPPVPRQQALPSVVDGHWQQQGMSPVNPATVDPLVGGERTCGTAAALRPCFDRVVLAATAPATTLVAALPSLFGICVLAYPAGLWIGLFDYRTNV